MFPSWLRRTLLKHCDRITRRKVIRTVPLEGAPEVIAGEPTPPDRLEQSELEDAVLDAVRQLPEPQRVATSLFYINGYSQAEVAEFLEVPVTTVQKRLHDSRRKLKERMLRMAEKALKANVPEVDFSRKIMDKIHDFYGDWRVKDGELSGRWGRDPRFRFHGGIVTKEGWPGDCVVVEFEGMSLAGLDGAHLECGLLPRQTLQETKEAGLEFPKFAVHISCHNKYRWSGIHYETFQGDWSRPQNFFPHLGEFNGRFGKWYRVKAERIGRTLRLWVDDVPIFEHREDSPPPEKVWVTLLSTVSHNRFRSIRIYRPDKKYVQKHSRPMRLFAPFAQRLEVLSRYPEIVTREAGIELRARNRSKGIVEWVGDDGGTVAETRVAERACRRADREGEAASRFQFRLEEPDGWNRLRDIRLEIEYLDRGTGTLAVFYNTWYSYHVTTEDLPRGDTGEWCKHVFHLREIAFREFGRKGCNFTIAPLHGENLYLRSVRLLEVDKPPEGYEELAKVYRREARRWSGHWPEPHYLYHLSNLIRGPLGQGEKAERLWNRIIEEHYDSECVEAHHHMQSHW